MDKLVRESLGFSRGEDPKNVMDIGDESTHTKEKLIEHLRNRGIRVRDYKNAKPFTSEKLRTLIKMCNFFNGLGVEDSKIYVDNDSVRVDAIGVYRGNWSIATVFNKEDANAILNTHKAFDLNRGEWRLDDTVTERFYTEDWLRSFDEETIQRDIDRYNEYREKLGDEIEIFQPRKEYEYLGNILGHRESYKK